MYYMQMRWVFDVMKIKDQRGFGEGVCLLGLHQQRLLELHGSEFAVFHMCLILVTKSAVSSSQEDLFKCTMCALLRPALPSMLGSGNVAPAPAPSHLDVGLGGGQLTS